MPRHDDTKQLDAVLGYLVGRRLSTREVCAALGLSRSTYYEQRDQGRLVTADNVITAAVNLDLNPVDLLVRCGLVPAGAAVEYAVSCCGLPVMPPAHTTGNHPATPGYWRTRSR